MSVPTEMKDRSASLAANRKAKMDELFAGKKFTILQEIHLNGDERFVTPFGNKGRNGYAISEEGNPSNRFIVGATVLKQAAAEYGAVTLPEPKRKKKASAPAPAPASDTPLFEEPAAPTASPVQGNTPDELERLLS
jgi:hypothetical protein